MVSPELEKGRFSPMKNKEGETDLTEEEARAATERLRAKQREEAGEDSSGVVVIDADALLEEALAGDKDEEH